MSVNSPDEHPDMEQPFGHSISLRVIALPQKRTDRNEVVASDKNPTEGEVGEVPTCVETNLTERGVVASERR
jgi:hypothetical protein